MTADTMQAIGQSFGPAQSAGVRPGQDALWRANGKIQPQSSLCKMTGLTWELVHLGSSRPLGANPDEAATKTLLLSPLVFSQDERRTISLGATFL
jgi:hypothetical protein